jgi:hypothetical protein
LVCLDEAHCCKLTRCRCRNVVWSAGVNTNVLLLEVADFAGLKNPEDADRRNEERVAAQDRESAENLRYILTRRWLSKTLLV